VKEVFLSCEGVSLGYADGRGKARVLIRELDMRLHAGEILVLLGRNGAGKSTLLRTLAGLQSPLRGQVALRQEDMTRLTRRQVSRLVAWVTPFRDFNPAMTGWELTALGRQPHTAWHGRLGKTDIEAIEAALRRCGAGAYAQRPLGSLSDGERQRLLLARAVAQETPVLLLDEPTAFLDRPGRSMVFRLARELAQAENRALIISSHDLELALKNGDTALLLHGDQGLHRPCSDADLHTAIDSAFEEERGQAR